MQLLRLIILSVSCVIVPMEAMNLYSSLPGLKQYFRFPSISIIGTPLQNAFRTPHILIEHRNITEQKKFDTRWQETFANEIDTDPLVAAKEFKQALANNSYTSSHHHPFFLGLSSSAYQFEGGINEESSWNRFAQRNGFTQPGDSVDFWNQYSDIIKEMKKQVGINAYRLSISWERIQKSQGAWDLDAIEKYKNIILELRKNNIEPLVVLHHYTIPTWFEDLGGFEKEENIEHFVKFAITMYEALHDKVIYWSTFNAIEGYAFKGYWQLDGPPGKPELKSMQTTVEVMKNMLKAHVEIYRAIKGIPNEQYHIKPLYIQRKIESPTIAEPQIGIQKNIVPLDLASFTRLQYTLAPLTWLFCDIGNKLQNDGFYGFFTQGRFKLQSSVVRVNVDYFEPAAPYTLDWIGLNTYSNKLRFLLKDVLDIDLNKRTANDNYRFYPEGIERAVESLDEQLIKPLQAKINKQIPIWITENGIATEDNKKRDRFFSRALLVIRKLLEGGYPIMGYTPWASHDNYEWPSTKQPDAFNSRRYGMFRVDFTTPERKRFFKGGSPYFANFVKAVNQSGN